MCPDAFGFCRLCGGANNGDDHYNDTTSYDNGSSPRNSSDPTAATNSPRNSDGRARTSICLDERLLAVDRDDIRLGAGDLDNPPKTSRSLGGRPLGAPPWRLDIYSRPLAINNTLIVASD